MNDRDVSLGLVVLSARAGVAVGRFLTLPVRIIVRGPLAPIAVRMEREASRAGVEARVQVRTAAEEATGAALKAPELERMLDIAFEGPLPDAVARRVVDLVLEGPELERVVEHVAASPVVRNAVARQTTSFADEVAEHIRVRCVEGDDLVEQKVRSLFRRRPRAVAELYGGVVTRSIAFVVDLMLAAVAFLGGGAVGVLILSIFGSPSRVIQAVALSVWWFLATATYFVVFWSAIGQTPGMRVMRERVVGPAGRPPSVLRSLLRFVVLTFGVILLGVTIVLMLFDERRRGLHDILAGTVVVSTASPSL
jgi:uncharacterized RDD family membrane protein YckC